MGSFYSKTHPSRKRFALGIIDVQNDFCDGGSIAVPNANSILAPINKLRFLYYMEMPTFLSQDYHNMHHMSFARTHKKSPFDVVNLRLVMENGKMQEFKQQTLWPVHCVEDTRGAEMHPDLVVTITDEIIRKGTKVNVESYSAFGDEFGGLYEKTNLHSWLKAHKITDLLLTGLATDYCVYRTVLDAVRLGYKVHLIGSCMKQVSEANMIEILHDFTAKGVMLYETVDEFHYLWKDEIKP